MRSPYLFFFFCLLNSIFAKGKKSIAITDLFHKFSYRYLQTESRHFLTTVKYFKKSWVLLFTSRRIEKNKDYGTKLGLDSSKNLLDEDKKYLQFNKKSISSFITKDQLPNSLSFWMKIMYSLQLFMVYFIIQIYCLFVRDKSKPSLILLELTEALLISDYVKKKEIKELLNFNAYEKDVYFLSFYLSKKFNIKITLIPSSTPLSLFYKQVYCDTFVFSASFQEKEVKKIKHYWRVKRYEKWRPQGADEIVLNVKPESTKKDVCVLGFFSSGMALRKELGHPNNDEYKDYYAEMELLNFLKSFIKTNKKYQLIVYLHPLEKRNEENMRFSKCFYQKLFGKEVKYAPFESKSKKYFNLCDIGVSGFSSSQIERLYGGYKVIFTPFHYFENYFGDERLDNISAKSIEALKSMIFEIREMTDETYFNHYNLREYRWDSYK